jgi:hypothetical membrane protein
MAKSAIDARSGMSALLSLAVSVCLSVFAERQFKVIANLLADLGWRHDHDVLWNSGSIGICLVGLAWAILCGGFALVLTSRFRSSTYADVLAAFFGAAIGGLVGVWLDAPTNVAHSLVSMAPIATLAR